MSIKSFSLEVNRKINSFDKTIVIDSDKSISIRSFLISSICNNISNVSNVLESEDVFSAINCLRKLGVKIIKIKSKQYKIYGKGLGSLRVEKNINLNFGNSGTLARLLIGILTTTPGIKVNIRGDKSLNKRNMSKLFTLMGNFGAKFYPDNKINFPIRLNSSNMPVGINYQSGVSAQLKSAVILAGLNAYGYTNILEKKLSRNHTENILKQKKKILKIKKNLIKVSGKEEISSLNITVPGDPSSAAFIVALTLLNKNSYINIKKVGLNSRRIGFYKLMKKFGAKIKFKNIKKMNNEPVGDIIVQSSKLKPIKASANFYASSTDEYPIMFVIAALTKGVSIFRGIEDLVNKESNRIEEMKKILKQIGIKCVSKKNEIKIYGSDKKDYTNKIIKVPNLGDHRICMSTVVLSLITGAKSNINHFETVKTSSPSFLNIIKSLGANYEIKKKS